MVPDATLDAPGDSMADIAADAAHDDATTMDNASDGPGSDSAGPESGDGSDGSACSSCDSGTDARDVSTVADSGPCGPGTLLFGAVCAVSCDCASNVCFTFGDGTRACTLACTTNTDCPAGSMGQRCNLMGVCRP